MNTFGIERGPSSLLISVPHAGTCAPPALLERIVPATRHLPDTDWFVHRLYEWAPELGVSLLTAPLSRYVIDLNRAPDDAPLYDTSVTSLLTGLVPTHAFSGTALYAPGDEPPAQEVRERVERYWEPYHQCLGEELERIRQAHGYAVLLDAHSIRSAQPLLFDGTLPDLNLGSNGGKSAAASLIATARHALGQSPWSFVLDGRFKGGYITRHYGQPEKGVHALQLEMAQCVYMREDPPAWDEERAPAVQALLRGLVQALLQWTPGRD